MGQTRLPSIWLWASLTLSSMSLAFGKQAAVSMERYDVGSVVTNYYYFVALACLGFQALTWQIALTKHPLSYAYFFMTGVFVTVFGLSFFVFDETLTPQNIVGAVLIAGGIYVMTRQGETPSHG